MNPCLSGTGDDPKALYLLLGLHVFQNGIEVWILAAALEHGIPGAEPAEVCDLVGQGQR